jgi:Fe-Mn family superoxide dismutase
MAHTLPALDYAHNALEPHIDSRTMEIHHGKHHQAYVDNLNKALDGHEMQDASIEDIMANISKLPPAVRNNGGGHYNHSLFWKVIGPSQGTISEALQAAIDKDLGGIDKLKADFNTAAMSRFGSGWAWLSKKADGTLCVCSSPNQDNPAMDIAECPGIPILGVDVWEHAYYLNYQNRRADYLAAFWNLVNWDEVSKRFSL